MSTKDGPQVMKDTPGYFSTGELIALAKEACHMTKPNSEMTDNEIRIVMRWVGEHTPDTSWVDGKLVFGRAGINLMLFMTVSEFPKFYREYGLSQFN